MSEAMFNPMDLTGRRILVTGASSGIGRAAALLLARLGARVVVSGRDAGRLEETLAQLPGQGHAAEPYDLSDGDGVPAWMKGLAQSGGPLAGVAHCAGLQISRPVRSVDRAFFDETMHANLYSAFALARGLRQKGVKDAQASMVLVASVAALMGQPGNTVYGASKGALIAATKGLAMELLRDGIRVNCIAPALVDTEMAGRTRQQLTPDQFRAIEDRHPLGLGRPEDVANSVAFLLADTARWITGTTLLVDGGHMIR